MYATPAVVLLRAPCFMCYALWQVVTDLKDLHHIVRADSSVCFDHADRFATRADLAQAPDYATATFQSINYTSIDMVGAVFACFALRVFLLDADADAAGTVAEHERPVDRLL